LRSRFATLICLAGVLPGACGAQQSAAAPKTTPATYSLREVLVHLEENLADYVANVPNIFCDEHVISDIELPHRRRTFRTTTDSIFRLRRATEISAKANTFSESREVKTVNGVPAKGETVRGPAIFTGAFSGALSVVSLKMARCYDYTLEPPGQLDKIPVLTISFALKSSAMSDQSCPGPEKESGHAWIDPESFHILRIVMSTPNHRMDPTMLALWTWAVNYTPVTFDNKQFWMPSTISTRAKANDVPVAWSFTATYSNYHKLIVTSHIITDVGDDPPPPQ
jgi:hypothetical protein